MKTTITVAVALVLSPALAHADTSSGNPLCALDHTPTMADLQAAIAQLVASDAGFTDTDSLSVKFGPTKGAAAATACLPDLISNALTCTMTFDPALMNAVSTPILYDHEYFHAFCGQTNCALNAAMVNAASPLLYQNTPSQPFSAQEVFTHYNDYKAFADATRNAIDNNDQATATYAANWATESLRQYNEMYSDTMQTIGTINAALIQYAGDPALAATGTTTDGALSISFPSFAITKTGLSTLTGGVLASQPGIQVTLKDPDAVNGLVSANYVLTDPSIASSPSYAAALVAVQRDLDGTSSFLASLPPALPAQDVYNAMVAAGYAPANSFNTSDLSADYFSYSDANPHGAIGPLNGQNLPAGADFASAPVCSDDPPYVAGGSGSDSGSDCVAGAGSAVPVFTPLACSLTYAAPDSAGSGACMSDLSWVATSCGVTQVLVTGAGGVQAGITLLMPATAILTGVDYAVTIDSPVGADLGAIDVSPSGDDRCHVDANSDTPPPGVINLDDYYDANGFPFFQSGSSVSVNFTKFDLSARVFQGTLTAKGACWTETSQNGTTSFVYDGVKASVVATF